MTSENAKQTVLVVDDDPDLRRLLQQLLESNGFQVVMAGSGAEAIDEAARRPPKAILLDLGLPDMDGLALLRRLREWSRAAVIVLSARTGVDDKIAALDGGANDYVTKPFSNGELLARLRAALRPGSNPVEGSVFRSGRLQVDLGARAVRVQQRRVRLTATEYGLLLLFIRHAGRTLTHGEIIREMWSAEKEVKTGQLRVYIAYLREKLELNPRRPELLITEPGVGYRLALPE
jgi:two-component system KDP operon response regulator KdpE